MQEYDVVFVCHAPIRASGGRGQPNSSSSQLSLERWWKPVKMQLSMASRTYRGLYLGNTFNIQGTHSKHSFCNGAQKESGDVNYDAITPSG